MYALIVTILFGFLALERPPNALQVQQADGKTVWDQSCKKCHGVKGAPTAGMKRMMPKMPVLDSAFVSTLSMESVINVINKGKGTMKPLAQPLTPAQVTAVSKYVFELVNAQPVSAKAAK